VKASCERNRHHENPTRNRKSGLGNPPPTAGASELYPNQNGSARDFERKPVYISYRTQRQSMVSDLQPDPARASYVLEDGAFGEETVGIHCVRENAEFGKEPGCAKCEAPYGYSRSRC